jgi:predicted nucleotidyltransferase
LRDEPSENSDVDLLVEFSRPIGLFEFVRLQRELGEQIGRKVELVTPAALKHSSAIESSRKRCVPPRENGGCASKRRIEA